MSLVLSEIILNKIRDEGPITFRDFMEMALYYPELGYYSSVNEKFGKSGDYFTAPFFTNVYGSIIAKQLEEMWRLASKEEFTIVEYGAGSGALCADILDHLQENKQFYKNLRYCIIEKSDSLRDKQKQLFSGLPSLQKISWLCSIDEISPLPVVYWQMKSSTIFPYIE